MGADDAMKASTEHRIRIGGRVVDYRVVRSNKARKLRVRVGSDGIEVVQPILRNAPEVQKFLVANGRWVIEQIDRVERLRGSRRTLQSGDDHVLYRGELIRVRLETTKSRA